MESYDSLTNFYTYNSESEIRESAISSEETSSIWKQYNSLIHAFIYLYIIQNLKYRRLSSRADRPTGLVSRKRISYIKQSNYKLSININYQGKIKSKSQSRINPLHKYITIDCFIRNEREDSTDDFFSMLEEIKTSSIYFIYYLEEDSPSKISAILKVDNSKTTLKKLTDTINSNSQAMKKNLIEINLHADFSKAGVYLKRNFESCIIHSNLEEEYLDELLGRKCG